MKTRVIKYVLLLCLLSLFIGEIEAQFAIPKYVFGNGGIEMSASTNRIIGTIGQTCIGLNTGSANREYVGFWYASHYLATGVDREHSVPAGIDLEQNHPNPFTSTTTISYVLPRRSDVEIVVFNIFGQQVRTLLQTENDAGKYTLSWNGVDDVGRKVMSGLYVYQLRAGSVVIARKAIILQ